MVRGVNTKPWKGIPADLETASRALAPLTSEAPPEWVKTYRDEWNATRSCMVAFLAESQRLGTPIVPANRLAFNGRNISAINEALRARSHGVRLETARRTALEPRRYRLVVEAGRAISPLSLRQTTQSDLNQDQHR